MTSSKENPSKEFQERKTTPRRKSDKQEIEIEKIISAHKLIINKSEIVMEPELAYNRTLSERYQAQIYLKREDRQRGKEWGMQGGHSRSEEPITSI